VTDIHCRIVMRTSVVWEGMAASQRVIAMLFNGG